MKQQILFFSLSIFSFGWALAEEWEQSFDLGATVSKGNSDSILATTSYSGELKNDEHEFGTNVSYTYGEEDEDKTNDELLADTYWNKLLNEKLYAGLRLDLRIDTLAEIDYRLTLSGVIGYYLIKTKQTQLGVEVGPGITTEQVGGAGDDYFSVYLGQKFDYKVNEKTKIFESLGITGKTSDLDDYSVVFEAGVETSLSETLSLKVLVQNKYESEPPAGIDKNDFKFVTGISYKF